MSTQVSSCRITEIIRQSSEVYIFVESTGVFGEEKLCFLLRHVKGSSFKLDLAGNLKTNPVLMHGKVVVQTVKVTTTIKPSEKYSKDLTVCFVA